jgi:hypothetical protein
MAQAKRSDRGTFWLLIGLSLIAAGLLLDRVSGESIWQCAQIALIILASGAIGASIPLMVSRRTR